VIVPRALDTLGAAGLVERVLPPDADTLLAAARLPEVAGRPGDRRLILARALALLECVPPQGPGDLYQRACLYRETGRPGDAAAALRLALDGDPDRAEWRYQLADLLYRNGDPAGAARELRRVFQLAPGHPGARELNGLVLRAQGAGS
jgi:tetratricopeptide (TPR) repeat protein